MTSIGSSFRSVSFSICGRVARIVLNRPERLNAIDETMPDEIAAAVSAANADNNVKAIVVSGAGAGFCAGYDLKEYAEVKERNHPCSQSMPWDPQLDFRFMSHATECFMSLHRSHKPTIAQIHGACIGGGSDIALLCDVTFADNDASIGYPPSRVWGCPTSAIWAYRIGFENAKRILFTGDKLSGEEAARLGLIGEAVQKADLSVAVEAFLERLATVPSNQLFFQKLVINQVMESMGLLTAQRLATLCDGMTRHTPEGVAFQQRCAEVGFKQAVRERDSGRGDAAWLKT